MAILTLIFVCGWVLMMANGHGVLTQVSYNGQTSCAVHTDGCTSTDNLKMREIIPRSGNTGDCALPPGCVADFFCDHCGLEKVETGANSLDSSKWWLSTPSVNWDLDISKPIYPCMSNDDFGARGTMGVSAGSVLNTQIYINADHSGLYRFQLMCGTSASNADFDASPITDWKALHVNKEGVQLDDARDVGSTRAETDAYFMGTTCTGAGCSYRMNSGIQGATSSHCLDNPDDCFIEDEVTIPSDIGCTDNGILRWLWHSAEGPEVYANCLDLDFSGSGNGGVDTSGEDETVIPANPTNTGTCFEGESCTNTPTCCPVGEACYEKDTYWASCRSECTAGIDPNDPVEWQTPWSCVVLGGDVNAEATNVDSDDLSAGPSVQPIFKALLAVATIANF